MTYSGTDTFILFTTIAEGTGVAATHVETADAGGGTDGFDRTTGERVE